MMPNRPPVNARARLLALDAQASAPITLALAKIHCRIECNDEDALVQQLVDVATAAAADRTGRALLFGQYLLTLDAFPANGAAVQLLFPPVSSVQSVTYVDADGAQQTLYPSVWQLDTVSEPARLLPAVGSTWSATQARPNAVQVRYTAGYAQGAVPVQLRQWILLAVSDLYENRSRSADRPVVPQEFADGLLDAYRIWSL